MANKRLLLIEDDYDVAEMLVMYFRSHEYDVLHADTGLAGIEMARTRFPNLILLDVMLPYMDGYDVCIKLRSTSLTKYIPIVFLTQRDERAAKVRGLELGADDYITKPFDIDELRLRVQSSINRATRENLHEPRTGLPTGPMVEEEINRRVMGDEAFTEIIYTVSQFAPYHDAYGFMAAADVLSHAGKTIQTVISEVGTPDDFVGILNDDFIVLTHTPNVEALDAEIKQRFEREVRAFYNFMDADRGGLLLNEGANNERLIPLMTFASSMRPQETAAH
ncbi:MAG: response regulator transcription factor [bacterium]|nr:response regulator transcription factor [bacterium]